MKNSVLILVFFLSIISCTKEKVDDYPSCLNAEIQNVLSSPPLTVPTTIDLYLYKNEKVYVLSESIPDKPGNVYNSKCEVICTVGGIDGNKSTTCEDWESAKFVKTVWTDKR